MEWLEELFEWLAELFDVNDDNHIDVSDLSAGAHKAVENTVNFIDYNNNSVIDSGDLSSRVWSYIDKNGSGKFESEDFALMLRDAFDKNGDGQVTPIDMQISKLAAEIGEDCGPVAKAGFMKAARYLL
jgi:Ca2+-binding EF-hand superfamily protein